MKKFVLIALIRRKKRDFVRAKCFKRYEDIKRVLLFFNLAQLEAVVPLVRQLEAEGKVVSGYCLDKPAKEDPALPAEFQGRDKSTMGWFSVPKTALLERMKAFGADTLIDLSMRPTPEHGYLYFFSQAAYRVGFSLQDPSRFDLLLAIDGNHEAPFFFQQLLFYLKSLRTS